MANIPNLDNLTPEQVEKLKNVNSMEELFEFAADEGIEFTSEQLEHISGGGDYLDASVANGLQI